MRGGQRRMEARRAPAPEPGYWAAVYLEYYEEVRRYFLRRVRCPQDAEDLAQSVFVRLIASNCSPQYPHMYVWTAARNLLCSYLQWKKRNLHAGQTISDSNDALDPNMVRHDWESDPLEQLSKREVEAVVSSRMRRLSPILSEALRLRFLSGLRLGEAAMRAGCSRETLKKRLKRARQSLTEFVGGEADCCGG
jgi:RNA polymerase sigma factor (sigma-70 family)